MQLVNPLIEGDLVAKSGSGSINAPGSGIPVVPGSSQVVNSLPARRKKQGIDKIVSFVDSVPLFSHRGYMGVNTRCFPLYGYSQTGCVSVIRPQVMAPVLQIQSTWAQNRLCAQVTYKPVAGRAAMADFIHYGAVKLSSVRTQLPSPLRSGEQSEESSALAMRSFSPRR